MRQRKYTNQYVENNEIDLHSLGGKIRKEYFICKSVKHLGPQVVNANIKR